MDAKRPMEFSQALLDHLLATAVERAFPDSRVGDLKGMIDAFRDIPSSLLDRVARVVVREIPACDAVLRKFAAHVHHRDNGIGDLLAVAFTMVSNDAVRSEMCSIYAAAVSKALKARSEGRFNYDGLGQAAARTVRDRACDGMPAAA